MEKATSVACSPQSEVMLACSNLNSVGVSFLRVVITCHPVVTTQVYAPPFCIGAEFVVVSTV